VVNHAKLLGLIIKDSFNAESMHVNYYILALCNKRIFSVKRLRDQGLAGANPHCPEVSSCWFSSRHSLSRTVCFT